MQLQTECPWSPLRQTSHLCGMIDRVLSHPPIRRPLAARYCDHSTLRHQNRVIPRKLRGLAVPLSHQRPQPGPHAENLLHLWPAPEVSLDVLEEKTSLRLHRMRFCRGTLDGL